MTASNPGASRRRIVKKLALALAATAGAYVVVLLHPQPLFAYTLQRGNVELGC